jgi:hypothetical protein
MIHRRGTEDAEKSGFVCRELPTDKTKPPLKTKILIEGQEQLGRDFGVLSFEADLFICRYLPANENFFSVPSVSLW